ncbi:MAG: hypothetical protein V1756_00645 [Patescibacteria group bacterium]
MEGLFIFKKLSEFKEGGLALLTLRATNAVLVRRGDTAYLVVILPENDTDIEVMTSTKERREHSNTVSPEWLSIRLEEWRNGSPKVTVATPEHPLEIVTGDVCVILEIEGQEYVVTFYRDIPPKGYLPAGGCSKNKRGIFFTRETANRETFEEFMVGNDTGTFYTLGHSAEAQACLEENLQIWGLKADTILHPDVIEWFFPKKGEAQNLIIEQGVREYRTENASFFIAPQTASVAMTLFWKVSIPAKLSELRFFDGEKSKDNSLLKRPVRLTTRDGKPVAIYVYGNEVMNATWHLPSTKERATF